MSSKRDTRIEELQAALDSVSEATIEELFDQGKKAAASMLLAFGDKTCLSATGFIYCVQQAHEAALLHMLAEGTVVLADSARASDEERAETERRRAEARDNPEVPHMPKMSAGAYL